VITDLEATRVRTEILEPALRAGDYYEGIRAGLAALAEAAGGEFRGRGSANSDGRRRTVASRSRPIPVLGILLALALLSGLGRRARMGPMIFGPSTYGRRGRMRRSIWWGGGFGGGGFGGGGFGGGGGGFSGGGGAFGGGGSRGGW
jgi:uncharacterized protein